MRCRLIAAHLSPPTHTQTYQQIHLLGVISRNRSTYWHVLEVRGNQRTVRGKKEKEKKKPHVDTNKNCTQTITRAQDRGVNPGATELPRRPYTSPTSEESSAYAARLDCLVTIEASCSRGYDLTRFNPLSKPSERLSSYSVNIVLALLLPHTAPPPPKKKQQNTHTHTQQRT